MAAQPSPLQIISNTTPISNFIRIKQLSLLGLLYGRITIPLQVADELVRGRHVLGDWQRVAGSECIEVIAPTEGPLLRQLRLVLDEGESAAIALAIERAADLLLMDELAGRRAAAVHMVPFTGTLGILLDAKRAGYIQAVRPLLDDLASIGFFVHASLRERVLQVAGEG